jgi:type VI secretion system ImpA family protein
MINLESMAKPLEGENPAGANCEYDNLYLGMDALAVEVPETEMGDSTAGGREPDWKTLNKNCLSLWEKTRDFRVAAYLCISESMLTGLSGLAAGLKLIHFLVSDMWDTAYPPLDADDDNNPIERLNILSMLSPEAGSVNDPVRFISRLRDSRLAPALVYTIRDLLVAQHELQAAEPRVTDEGLLRGEILGAPAEQIAAQKAAVDEAAAELDAIVTEAEEKMSGGYALNMEVLQKELKRLAKFYESVSDGAGEAAQPAEDGGADTDTADGAAPQNAAVPKSAGAVNIQAWQPASRAEALLVLRKGADYFARQEPNSPIPYIVSRALRFAEMSFMDLLNDIAPDAVGRGRDILGIKDES